MPQIEIISEEELANAWRFVFQVLDDRGSIRKHTLILAWADYNLWSTDGADAPAKVAEAVLTFLLSKLDANELPTKFDASLARRQFGQADELIPKFIER